MSKTIVLAALITVCTIFSANPAKAYYNPQQGRFLTQDPTGDVDGMNLYGYVRDCPVYLADPMGLQATKINVGTSMAGYEANYLRLVVKHVIDKEPKIVRTGEDILDHLVAVSKEKTDNNGCKKSYCIRTWVHAQHGWSPNSEWGRATQGGFGGGQNGFYTGFYNVLPSRNTRGIPGTDSRYGGRARGGRDLRDLLQLKRDKKIRFCSPCRIYVYGCAVADYESFAARLSAITSCTLYAGSGKVNTTHSNGRRGTHEDPWHAEGGWKIYKGRQRNRGNEEKYIIPTTDW